MLPSRSNTPFLLVPLIVLGLLAKSAHAQVDLSLFDAAAFASDPVTMGCTLEDGSAATCAALTLSYLPPDLEIGPFCPASVSDTGGLWHWSGDDAPGLYQIDGAFLEFLAIQGYKMYDDTGAVFVTDVRLEQPGSTNTCLSASPDETVEMTVLLPLEPKVATQITDLGTVAKVGLALDGVPVFADAPTIQSTGHMPALDTCGGHIDPGGWYHWHAPATDMQSILTHENISADCVQPQDASALFGFAFDGIAIYGSLDADGTTPDNLDTCHGHVGPTAQSPEGAYHYHTTASFPSLPPCLVGLQAQNNFATTASQGIGSDRAAQGGPGGHESAKPPGLDGAAKQLGVTEETLMRAIDDAGGRDLDVAAAAAALGVSESALRAALPPPPQ